MMTKYQLNAFRKALENRQSELGNGSRNRESLAIGASADELDRIQHASDLDSAMGALERNSDRLREVRLALRSVDAGTFGICIGCEEDISPRRLAAIPWASCCVVCQEAADRGQAPAHSEFETSLVLAA
jgi:DnaK suppressor protein